MTNNLPDYTTVEPPDDSPPAEYSAHQRRGGILRLIAEAGTPAAVNQRQLADRYDVHESTISRDMDRLRESVDKHLGADAKLTTRTLFEKTVRELQAEGEYKKAWDVLMDWNDWLADIGEQDREPRRSELDIDMQSQNVDIAYSVVREGDDEDLPTTDSGELDYDNLGFTSSPATIDVDTPDRDD